MHAAPSAARAALGRRPCGARTAPARPPSATRAGDARPAPALNEHRRGMTVNMHARAPTSSCRKASRVPRRVPMGEPARAPTRALPTMVRIMPVRMSKRNTRPLSESAMYNTSQRRHWNASFALLPVLLPLSISLRSSGARAPPGRRSHAARTQLGPHLAVFV